MYVSNKDGTSEILFENYKISVKKCRFCRFRMLINGTKLVFKNGRLIDVVMVVGTFFMCAVRILDIL